MIRSVLFFVNFSLRAKGDGICLAIQIEKIHLLCNLLYSVNVCEVICHNYFQAQINIQCEAAMCLV